MQYVHSKRSFDNPLPRLGILVCHIDDEKDFFITVESIHRQKYENIEIILSACIYENNEKFKSIIEKNNIKVVVFEGHDIVEGLKKSCADYIALCESGDVFVDGNFLMRCEVAANYEYPDVVFNSAVVTERNFYSMLIRRKISECEKIFHKRINKLSDENLKQESFMPSLSCCMVKKEKLVSCDFCSPISQLLDCWIIRQFGSKNDILMIPEKLVDIRVTGKKIERLKIHPFCKRVLMLRGDFLLGKLDKKNLIFDERCISVSRKIREVVFNRKRLAIFASFNSQGIIDDSVVYYLKKLAEVVDGIVFVSDNPVFPSEIEKIEPYVLFAECKRHEEYDFGSYKRGLNYILENGWLDEVEELVMCNDSCYGPIFPFCDLFDEMNKRMKSVDFWGISKNFFIKDHVQSYFIVFKKRILEDKNFFDFFSAVRKHDDVSEVILYYEMELTAFLTNLGYSYDTYVGFSLAGKECRGVDFVGERIPLIKKKFFDGTYFDDKKTIMRLCNQIRMENFEVF